MDSQTVDFEISPTKLPQLKKTIPMRIFKKSKKPVVLAHMYAGRGIEKGRSRDGICTIRTTE